MKQVCTLALFVLGLSGCSTYQYSKNVKMVSFDDEVTRGKSVGPIRGEDCIWSVLGYKLGGVPTLDKAFANARNQTDSSIIGSSTQSVSSDKAIRYINNVSTDHDGWNAVLVGKECLVVKGTGYR
jgi:hypothetical protein